MKIFVFGAGASLGSQEKTQLEPSLKAPLVNSLLNPEYEKYSDAVYVSRATIRKIKDLIADEPLEEWLTAEWDRVGAPHGKEALAAGRKRFGDIALYIWWLMTNISKTLPDENGYLLFLQKLDEIDDKEEKSFVNFNYDLLLDKALMSVYGWNLGSSLTNYTTNNYLKPHGSVNWFIKMRKTDKTIPREDRSVQKELLFNIIKSQMFNGEPMAGNWKIVNPLNGHLYELSNLFRDSFSKGIYEYPGVVLPLSAKTYNLISGFMDLINSESKRIFSQATNIYLIGYRANDVLFHEMLKHIPRRTKLHVVGQNGAKSLQENVLKLNPKLIPGEVFDKGFYSFVENMK